MSFVTNFKKKYNDYKTSRPKQYRILLIILSAILFLGILPYDKNALVFFKSKQIGEYISYAITAIAALFAIFNFIVGDKSRKTRILIIGLVGVFALMSFGWIVGSLSQDTFKATRVLSIGCFFVYYLYVILSFDNKDDFILSLSISLTFLVALSFVYYFFKNPNVYYYEGYGTYRFKGIASNRNSFLELSLFPIVGFGYLAISTKKIKLIITYVALALFSLGATVFTMSITSILIAFLAVGLMLIYKWSYYLTNIYVVTSLFFLICVLAYFSRTLPFLSWFYTLVQKSPTLTGRTELWNITFGLIKNEYVFGSGFDNTLLYDLGKTQNDPHNGFIYILLNQGIFGLLLVFVILVFALKQDKPNNKFFIFMMIFASTWVYRSTVESGLSYTHFVFWSTIIMLYRTRIETEHKFPYIPKILKKENEGLSEDKVAIKKASSSTFMLYLLTFAKIVFPLVSLPYLTRVLSTDTYGTVSYVKSVMSYVQIVVDFGFIYSAVKDVVRHIEKREEVNKIISNTLLAKLLLFACSLVVVIVLCFTIPILNSSLLFTLLSCLTPLLTIFLYDFLFRGIEKMQFTTITFVVTKILSTALVFVFVKSDADILLIPIFDAVGTLVSIVIATIALYKNGYRIIKPEFKQALNSIKQSFAYFINIFSSTAFGILLTFVIGIAIPDATEISYWAVSMQLVGAVQSLYTPIANGIYPYMIKKKNLSLISIVLLLLMPVVLLGSLFCYFYSPLIIKLVSGENYVPGAYVFKTLAPVLFLSFPVAIIGWPVLGPINKTKEMTISTIAGAIVQVVCVGLLFALNSFNLLNLAITRSISEATMLGFRIFYLFKFKKLFISYRNERGIDMKAGIITHYDVHNHGAQLQLFCLTQVLKELGYDASALQFHKNFDFYNEKDATKKYSISARSIPYFIKYAFKNGFGKTLFNYDKRKILNSFRTKYKLVGDYYYNAKDLDVVVIGSDEIFSIEAGPNPWFYGIGIPCEYEISYAASFGPTTLEDIKNKNVTSLVAGGINNLKHISVRDQNSQEIITKLTNKKPQLVCDPVILCDYHKFIDLEDIKEYKDLLIKNYCLVYSYDKNMNDKKTVNAIKNYAKENKLNIISVGYYHKWCGANVNVDPLELYKLFSCANVVFTDTFHGTVLSLVTNTQFVTKVTTNKNKLQFLLSQFDLTSRIVKEFDEMDDVLINSIDFNSVNKKIESYRRESMTFLKESLPNAK